MEESERRRNRLRALRLEAEQQQPSPGTGDGIALPAPLLGKVSEPFGNHEASFDFYTDPLAVYAGAKRKGGVQLQLSHRVALSGMHQEGRTPLLTPAPARTSAPDIPSPSPECPTPSFVPPLYVYPRPPPNLYTRRGRGSGGHVGSRGCSRYDEGRGGPNSIREKRGGTISAEQQPELFYNKSMLENPWRHLKPKAP
eukprot:TRINITY_DN12092_c0_g2_i1.p1 TRINITY_DN12092_c0_g2~~TRINITY_DN12092_c0_g2_i1.p1  ORF type:complete len:223 (+),score=19.01 TRINITY_DN12092_c0_g2_i1:80-670(+)